MLVSKVFKAKYNNNLPLRQALVPKNSSWIWQCPAAARHPLKEVLMWKVENGRKIEIWCTNGFQQAQMGKFKRLSHPQALSKKLRVDTEFYVGQKEGFG